MEKRTIGFIVVALCSALILFLLLGSNNSQIDEKISGSTGRLTTHNPGSEVSDEESQTSDQNTNILEPETITIDPILSSTDEPSVSAISAQLQGLRIDSLATFETITIDPISSGTEEPSVSDISAQLQGLRIDSLTTFETITIDPIPSGTEEPSVSDISAQLQGLSLSSLSIDSVITTQTIHGLQVGDTVMFGRYKQNNENSIGNNQEAIEWIVLDVRDGKALLISRFGLDVKPFHTAYTTVTWENSSLRSWLNSVFLEQAFTTGEQSLILLTEVDNGEAQGYSRWNDSNSGSRYTQDKVFLLSYAEVNRYFGVQHSSVSGSDNNTVSRMTPTPYAIRKGAYTNNNYQTEDGNTSATWWLRSPGYFKSSAAVVRCTGSLYYSYVNIDSVCVRPAIWIDLETANIR